MNQPKIAADQPMPVLVADDDATTRAILKKLLSKWDYNVIEAADGRMAWMAFAEEASPRIAILDWEMPGFNGVEICQKIRTTFGEHGIHIILLTARDGQEHRVAGLEAGADDYLVKPFHPEELRARIRVARRILAMHDALTQKVEHLEETLQHVRELKSRLVICSYCQKVRNESNAWETLEAYLTRVSQISFSHTICPGCHGDTVEKDLPNLDQTGKN